jgi:hypothetical protein
MAFPSNLAEMKTFGYKFLDYAVCRECGSDIEFWLTPRGKKIPMDPMTRDADKATAHFATCPDAPLFRKD